MLIEHGGRQLTYEGELPLWRNVGCCNRQVCLIKKGRRIEEEGLQPILDNLGYNLVCDQIEIGAVKYFMTHLLQHYPP